MSNNRSSGASTGGTSLGTLLLVAFIVLKLAHVIDWSWWWVLSPLWIGAGLTALILAGAVIAGLVAGFGKR